MLHYSCYSATINKSKGKLRIFTFYYSIFNSFCSKKNKKELKIEYLEIFGHFVRQKKKKKKEINKRKKNITKDYLKTE